MPSNRIVTPIRSTLADIARGLPTLALGAFFGWLMFLIHTPLPWFFGALLSVAAVNLCGIRIRAPRGARQLGQILVGTTIGLYFTPAVAAIVAAQLPWMVLAAFLSIALGGLGAVILMRIARVDGATAFFGNVPGGMAEMLTLGDRFGAQPVPLTLSQLTRVTIVILSIPPALTFFGQTGHDAFVPLAKTVDPPMLALLMLCAFAGSLTLFRLKVPNCWMLGAATVVSLLTVFDVELSAMPRPFLNVAQICIGTALGERFMREAMTSAPMVILGSAITTVIMMAVAILLAIFISHQTGMVESALIAATAPGGLAEMSLTAAVLNLGVPLVTAYHVVRILMITSFTLPAFHLARRFLSRGRAA